MFYVDPRTSKRNIPVRLVGGSHSAEGRVEVNVDGEWGTINNQYWDIRDATVICRMLGFQFALQAGGAYYRPFRFGRGSGPIWFGFLNCLGSERSIVDCNIYTYTPNLYGYSGYNSHDYDAGVICYAST